MRPGEKASKKRELMEAKREARARTKALKKVRLALVKPLLSTRGVRLCARFAFGARFGNEGSASHSAQLATPTWTNQTQEAWLYSHDGPIRRRKR
eukprot:827419-Prorocentrum_minimum.AAC.1